MVNAETTVSVFSTQKKTSPDQQRSSWSNRIEYATLRAMAGMNGEYADVHSRGGFYTGQLSDGEQNGVATDTSPRGTRLSVTGPKV